MVEQRATREGVAVYDQSSFAKLEVSGPDACRVLQRLCGNNVDVANGRLVYTGMFNARGTFESDLTQIHQDFADCSRAKALPPSLISAFDRRNPANGIVLDLTEEVPVFNDKIDATSTIP